MSVTPIWVATTKDKSRLLRQLFKYTQELSDFSDQVTKLNRRVKDRKNVIEIVLHRLNELESTVDIAPPHHQSKRKSNSKSKDKRAYILRLYENEPNKRKKTISKSLKIQVWNSRFGLEARSGHCYACGKEIKIETFHCAHIISEAEGGKTLLENLRPSCALCNGSCGTQNLDKFREQFD